MCQAPVLQNSGSRMTVLKFTALSAQDRHWWNPRKKNCRERSNIKSACVSALTGSVSRKMAEERQSDSALIMIQTHVAKLTVNHLNHQAITSGSYRLLEIYIYMTCRISQPATVYFCVQDCFSRIAQVEYQGQTRNTRILARYTKILERKPLIGTFYRIWHILDLKYFHFAQFLLNGHRGAHRPQKKWELITWNLGQIFEWIVGPKHSRWVFTKADCS